MGRRAHSRTLDLTPAASQCSPGLGGLWEGVAEQVGLLRPFYTGFTISVGRPHLQNAPRGAPFSTSPTTKALLMKMPRDRKERPLAGPSLAGHPLPCGWNVYLAASGSLGSSLRSQSRRQPDQLLCQGLELGPLSAAEKSNGSNAHYQGGYRKGGQEGDRPSLAKQNLK